MLRTLLRGFPLKNVRNVHVSAVSRLREIVVHKQDEKTTVIEAKYVPSPRTPYLIKDDPKGDKCILCELKLDLKHTDVLILSQFVNKNGEIMRRKDLNICCQQYEHIKQLIYMAQYAGLMPEPERKKKPYDFMNTYYDESTIILRKKRSVWANKFHKLRLGPIEKLRVQPEKGTRM